MPGTQSNSSPGISTLSTPITPAVTFSTLLPLLAALIDTGSPSSTNAAVVGSYCNPSPDICTTCFSSGISLTITEQIALLWKNDLGTFKVSDYNYLLGTAMILELIGMGIFKLETLNNGKNAIISWMNPIRPTGKIYLDYLLEIQSNSNSSTSDLQNIPSVASSGGGTDELQHLESKKSLQTFLEKKIKGKRINPNHVMSGLRSEGVTRKTTIANNQVSWPTINSAPLESFRYRITRVVETGGVPSTDNNLKW